MPTEVSAGALAAPRPAGALSVLRARTRALVEARWFATTITALILINAVALGAETFDAVTARWGGALLAIDRAILAVFVVELSLRLFAHGRAFFRDPWSWFDTIVVGVALVPASEGLSVLRALRVLRVLRLVSAFPQLRRVVTGLLSAIPGLASIIALLAIILYVFAVVATKLFGDTHPEWFGTLPGTVFTLFQIMTLEGWADIVREVMKTQPWAWVFFLAYILASTFTVLNFFIAVIVDTMQKANADEDEARDATVLAEIRALREEVALLRAGR
jgi:voltage-gated sodium channel